MVALLAPAGGNLLQECTGSLVRVTGSTGYVLTAAHCCNSHVPDTVVASSNYTVGGQYVGAGTPVPPVYRVVPGSVYYDSLYAQDSGLDHDFCMMQFSGASTSLATLTLPSTSDGLALGASIQHIGYGVTESGANADRRAEPTHDRPAAHTARRSALSQGEKFPDRPRHLRRRLGRAVAPPRVGRAIVAGHRRGAVLRERGIVRADHLRRRGARIVGDGDGWVHLELPRGNPDRRRRRVRPPTPATNTWVVALLAAILLLAGRRAAAY